MDAEVRPINWAATGMNKFGGIIGFAYMGGAVGSRGWFLSTEGDTGKFRFSIKQLTVPTLSLSIPSAILMLANGII